MARSSSNPVYLSAPGLLCCAGGNREEFFSAALQGDQSGIKPLTLKNGQSFLTGQISEDLLPRNKNGGNYRDSRILSIIDGALEQIRNDVEKALARYDSRRIGVCVGSCDNGSEWSLQAHRLWIKNGSFPENYQLRFQGAGYPAEYIAKYFELEGPALAISTACASGAGAIIKAAELIRSGFCDAVIAGGADIISPTVLLGFKALEAVSEHICNPFSKNRNGITLGEGAAFFLLSRQDDKGIALLGTGESADATHITAPREDGSGAIMAMEKALRDAGMEAAEVGYINLHGTGTALNDSMEARAMAAIFPKNNPPVSSTKPVTGHTLGAAGALELALCWMVLEQDGAALPPHCWDGVRDETLPRMNFAGKGTVVKNICYCMSNSFAFGGCNNSLVIGREN